MKRLILAAGGLLLATANTPPSTTASVAPGGELDSVVAAEAPKREAPATAKPAHPRPHKIAVAPAERRAGSYPRCSATVQDRCVQGRSRGPHHAAGHDRRIQLAMRAGERG